MAIIYYQVKVKKKKSVSLQFNLSHNLLLKNIYI